ncbi:hypothetical protein [Nostocoides veronense]
MEPTLYQECLAVCVAERRSTSAQIATFIEEGVRAWLDSHPSDPDLTK